MEVYGLEEKKAIESLKNIAIYIGDNYTFSQQGIRNLRENLRIVLPVIEKQSKEIEHQKEKRANQKKELAILNAKQIEFNKLVNTVNSYKGQFKRQEKEIEEKKKKNKPQPDCAEPIERIEEMVNMRWVNHNYINKKESEQRERKAYIKGINDAHELCNKKWEDKIKAKIEEIDFMIKEINQGNLQKYTVGELLGAKRFLESLLEKE